MLRSIKPAVPRHALLIAAGVLWSTAGLAVLNVARTEWDPRWAAAAWAAPAAGLVAGSMVAVAGFRRIVRANIARIARLPATSCLFAFQRWTGYVLVAFMMSLGAAVRRLDFLPGWCIVGSYTAIGSALLGSSVLYYIAAINQYRHGRSLTGIAPSAMPLTESTPLTWSNQVK